MSKVNKYNFLTWDNDGSPPDTTTDEYTMPAYLGDVISFYINFDNPITTMTGYELGIWIPSGIILGNIATLSQDYVNDTEFNIYSEWTVGVMPKPFFRFVIYDTGSSNAVVYWSNPLKYVTSTTDTVYAKFRNQFNGVNYQYESVTSFYNKFRLDCLVREFTPNTKYDGHELSDGTFKIAYSTLREKAKFYFPLYSRYSRLAAAHMITSTDIYIDDIRYARGESDQLNFEVRNRDTRDLYTGIVELDVYDTIVTASNT